MPGKADAKCQEKQWKVESGKWKVERVSTSAKKENIEML